MFRHVLRHYLTIFSLYFKAKTRHFPLHRTAISVKITSYETKLLRPFTILLLYYRENKHAKNLRMNFRDNM
jgi:hypothetical protein